MLPGINLLDLLKWEYTMNISSLGFNSHQIHIGVTLWFLIGLIRSTTSSEGAHALYSVCGFDWNIIVISEKTTTFVLLIIFVVKLHLRYLYLCKQPSDAINLEEGNLS